MGRLVVVFGAGGDRDRGKRPKMGRAVAELADVAIVTDDNPRSEDPATIRAMVLEGCPEAAEVADRAEAILRGVDALEPGDALLIAGKGHETGQTIGSTVYPFDDVEQASVAVAALDGRVA
jgi:UDP-N-acetylmuramoyl-L-alanyl-D-glutamate--2,6-diaminopimelate ligase